MILLFGSEKEQSRCQNPKYQDLLPLMDTWQPVGSPMGSLVSRLAEAFDNHLRNQLRPRETFWRPKQSWRRDLATSTRGSRRAFLLTARFGTCSSTRGTEVPSASCPSFVILLSMLPDPNAHVLSFPTACEWRVACFVFQRRCSTTGTR